MVGDPRDTASSVCQKCFNLDAFTNPFRLSPFRDAENGDSSSSSNQIGNYEYANGIIYGLGVQQSGTAFPRIFSRTDLTGSTWTEITGAGNIAISARTDADLPAFAYYKTTDRFYGVSGGTKVWSQDLTGLSTNTSEASITYTTVSNFHRHSKDDCLYLGYDNKIARNNAGSWTTAALTLPANLVVTSLDEYGNYLVIACRDKNKGSSKVFLWNRDSSLATIDEVLDWGTGELMTIFNIDGYLVGVSYTYTLSGTSLDNSSTILTRTTLRYWGGGQPKKFAEYTGASISPAVNGTLFKRTYNSRGYFMASIPIGTTAYQGIWSIARTPNSAYPFGLVLDRYINGGTTANVQPSGFIIVGDYVLSSYTVSGTYKMDKTDDAATYTNTSVYETTIQDAGDPTQQKQLLMVSVATVPLPSGGQVVLKYKKDAETSFTTILTHSTANAISKDATRKADGKSLPSFKEITLRLEITGGAEVTGLYFKAQEKTNRPSAT